MSEKIYCGNAKMISTEYGEIPKLSFREEDLKKLMDNLENGWVNAVVKKRREPSDGGMTHYIQVDTWKPKEDARKPKSEQEHESDVLFDSSNDPGGLPF